MVRKDYEKLFTPTPNSVQKPNNQEDILPSDVTSDFDKQLLVWGFTHLELHEPPAGLFDKIMVRIREEERLISIKKRLFLFSAVLLLSVAAFIPAFNVFRNEFAQSGLWQFASLLFSDLNLVMANWQDFGLAIFESLPVMSITVFLFTALVFLWSLKNLITTMQNANIKMQNFDIVSR